MKLKSVLNFGILVFLAVNLFFSCSPLDPKPDLSKGFVKFYTGVDYTYSSQLILTQEGGYAMIGSGLTDNDGQNIYVVKADSKGNKIWDRYLGTVNGDTGYSIQEDVDRNIIVLGVSNPDDSISNIYLAKIDGKSGIVNWEKNLNPNQKSCFGYDLKIINGGTQFLVGGAELDSGRKEVSVLKTNLDGVIVPIAQQPTSNLPINGGPFLELSSIIEGVDNGFVWVATTNNNYKLDGITPAGSPVIGIANFFGIVYNPVNKTDSKVLYTTSGVNSLDMVSAAKFRKTSDGYIVVGNSIKNGNSDAYLLKLNENLDVVWYKPFFVPGNEYSKSVEIVSDGGYIITGRKDISFTGNLTTSNTDVFVIKTDANGEIVWSKDFGGDGADFGTDIKQTPDGGFAILASMSLITSPQNKLQMALIKISANGKIEN